MNKLIKIPAVAAGAGAGLFAASLVVYYFNLDMRLIFDSCDQCPVSAVKFRFLCASDPEAV